MNRFFSVLMVTMASCTGIFAQSTNIVNKPTETIVLTNSQFSGETSAFAANIENVAELQIFDSMFEGGAGDADVTNPTSAKNGGAGLQMKNIDPVTISDSEFHGGNGGVTDVPVNLRTSANGGHGIMLLSSISLAPLDIISVGGTGGSVKNGDGGGKSFGGDGVHQVGDFAADDLFISGGSYQGGNGGVANFNSTIVSPIYEQTYLNVNGARGGHGLRLSRLDQFPNGSTLTINDGIFVGGDGGAAVNSNSGSIIADGGSGIFIDYMDVTINGGTFVGGSAGTTNGVAAVAGYGAFFQDSNVTITDGDFQGDTGLLFLSRYYTSTATISGGMFNNAVIRAIDDGSFPGFIGQNEVTISGGNFGSILFDGNTINNVTLTDGVIGELLLRGSGIYNLSMDTVANITDRILQFGGTANINQWSDHHFMDTTIHGGTMNFSGQGFNLTDGSSLALLSTDSAINFNDGFTAQSNSQITTTYDGTTHTTLAGNGEMVFEEGAKWTINGVSTITNKAKLTLASGSLMTSRLLDTDVEYLGGSWAAGVTVGVVGKNLIATYGFLDLQDSLGLDENDGGYGTAMAQFSDLTGFSDSDGYTEITGLPTAEAANTILMEQFNNNAMVGAIMQLQGVFADQIQDRTRSHLRYKNSTSLTRSPDGARGPDARSSLKSIDESAPSWDVSQSMRNMDDKAPRWDVSQSMRNVEDKAPKSAGDSINIPATYQFWGRGYGSYFKQGDTSDLVGYDGTVGGGVLGLDKRFNNLLLGLGGGYARTRLNGNGGSEDSANTFYGTAYAGVAGEKGFFDFNLNYAFNDIETEGSTVGGNYSSEYDASTFGMFLGGGWGFAAFNDSILFTPEASLLTTYYTRDSYTETAAIPLSATGGHPDLAWDSYDQWSYLSSLGATLSTILEFESFNLEMAFQPELRAHWLHEFNADIDDDSYNMGGLVTPINVAIQSREEDLVKVGAGVRFSQWDAEALEFGLDLDGVFGKDYDAYIISCKLLHRF